MPNKIWYSLNYQFYTETSQKLENIKYKGFLYRILVLKSAIAQ